MTDQPSPEVVDEAIRRRLADFDGLDVPGYAITDWGLLMALAWLADMDWESAGLNVLTTFVLTCQEAERRGLLKREPQ